MAFLFIGVFLFSGVCYYLYSIGMFNQVLCWSLICAGGLHWWVNFYIDAVFCLILLMLLVCFFYVLRYTHHYFSGDFSGFTLNKIICGFVAVMGVLVGTGDYLLTLVFWEYLGVVSFFLILFYSSFLSLRSSVVTLVSSRFGDVCLFLLIGTSGHFFSASPITVLVLYCFIILTKSASYPFISWLLEAMRAPTPVSSLVHSSTLVAAGVWFSMRYDLTGVGADFLIGLSIILLITIFITGVSCFFFLDLKKIVALSTCNNIAWCLLYLLFGDLYLSLFQLLSHGVSKCILFILVGDVMSGSGGSQSVNCVYSPSLYGNWGTFSMFSVVLGLSGAPFIGLFFTKHLLLCSFMGVGNLLLFGVVLACAFLSYFYSFRLCSILVVWGSSVSCGAHFHFSAGLIWVFWLCLNFFVGESMVEAGFLGRASSLAVLLFQLVSLAAAYFFYSSGLICLWSSSLFGCDNLVEASYHAYYIFVKAIDSCYYRWDHYSLGLFSGLGAGGAGVYRAGLLNIFMFSVAVLMCYYCVLY